MDVSLARCVVCPDCTSVKLPGSGDDAFVVCSEPCPEEDAGTAPERHSDFFVRPSGPGDRTTVAALMTAHVVCVAPDLHSDALERLFVDEGLTNVPVVDPAGLPLGVVSRSDLLRWHDRRPSRGDRTNDTVADIMSCSAVCITANTSIARAAALMAFENIESVLVVNPLGEVVGTVRAADVLAWFARNHGYVLPV